MQRQQPVPVVDLDIAIDDAERARLAEEARRDRNWKRWGPYLGERQWGTVREDYSADGDCWRYFPHDHARSRAYRWGEDGLLGFTDRGCRLCIALALWNERDPILKERLFGLTGHEGNHGEDVKECYYYLESTPTHSYASALYKYPQAAFPYAALVEGNAARSREEPELELLDTGVFDDGRYFDVRAEWAKNGPDELLLRVTISNRGDEAARLHVLPTLWFRNIWSWGPRIGAARVRPSLALDSDGTIAVDHESLGRYRFAADVGPDGRAPTLLFTENETNTERLFDVPNATPYVKDAFHRYLIDGDATAVNPAHVGTKAAALYVLTVGAGESVELRCRLVPESEVATQPAFGPAFDDVFAARMAEADAFYAHALAGIHDPEERRVARQAYAGLLWSKQFYHYAVNEWLEGDPTQPPPPPEHLRGRNRDWRHLYNADVILVPDKWEYPWYAAWDLAFHVTAVARVDPELAKQQLVLLLREWYMHPNGQMPAYEFAFGDVNPPVHAWACWRVYKQTGPRGARDRKFLERVFHKLLINFTWWVNRKDRDGNHVFGGGFLGLDNIGVFDRSRPLPTGGYLEQADGTAWMAFYCGTMLSMALELAEHDRSYEDVASKFFEHFVAIADAMNTLGGNGLWDDGDGFYYDQVHVDGVQLPLRVRSLVGLIPVLACEIIGEATLSRLPGFAKRMRWFLDNRPDLARHTTYMATTDDGHGHRMLAIPSRDRLERLLRYLLDEREFLSPHGIRSVSRVHAEHPAVFRWDDHEYTVGYEPAESRTGLFGGNSNWRGPIWFPINYLLIEALERYDHFYGEGLRVEYPVGSGMLLTLGEVARDLARRISSLFLPDAAGRRPAHGGDARYADDPYWRDLVLFHEYFHGDDGRGLGASHQTGWTALVARCLEAASRHGVADITREYAAVRLSGRYPTPEEVFARVLP